MMIILQKLGRDEFNFGLKIAAFAKKMTFASKQEKKQLNNIETAGPSRQIDDDDDM